MSPTEQRARSLELANAQRMEVVELRRRVRSGEVTLVDLFEDPPGCLRGMGLIDVLRIGFSGSGRYRVPRHVEELGRAAARDGINLLVPIDRASLRTRRWLVTRARWYRSNGRPGLKLRIEEPA